MALRGGFVDLEPLVDRTPLASLDEEILLGLTAIKTEYTGGSHKSMGIVPPTFADDAYRDYGHAIRGMSRDEYLVFISLSERPDLHDPDLRDVEWGEERAHALSRRQMLLLKMKYGVYFPWKVYVELMSGGRWEEKSDPKGKHFTRDALLHFPRTVAFVRSLPFEHVGSVKIMGLEGNDHGTVHRDGDPQSTTPADHFVTFCPRGDKRLFLWDEETKTKTYAPSRIYWFDDRDYHGVDPDPFFRYSIRVDGRFEPAFLARVR